MSLELEAVRLLSSVTRFSWVEQLLVDVTALGSYYLLPLYILVLTRFKEFKTAALTAASSLSTGFTVYILKYVFSRPRPAMAVVQATGAAFPSGHSAFAFTVAAVFSSRWENGKILFYSLAAVIALTRVFLGVHYITDIVAGSLIGFGVGKLFVRNREKVLSLLHFK